MTKTLRYRPHDVDVPRLLDLLGLDVAERDGDDLVLRCLWHSPDKHPSLRVVDARGTDLNGLHKCWSCGARGTAIDLARKALDLTSKSAAAEWIATKAQGPPPTLGGLRVKVASPTRAAFRMPPEYVDEPLADWPTPARRYAEARGLTAEQVFRYRIGYAVDGRLGGRIVVPTLDRAGRPASYAARSFCSDDKRYLYPHRREAPRLDVLFGEHAWRDRPLVLCEGALNALAVERARSDLDVAAIGGSSLLPAHANTLSLAPVLALLFDADPAGERARADHAAALGRHVPRLLHLQLPPGIDPASAILEELRDLLGAL